MSAHNFLQVLPAEMKNRIYDFCIPEGERFLREEQMLFPLKATPFNLLLVCKGTKEDIFAWFYARNHFRIKSRIRASGGDLPHWIMNFLDANPAAKYVKSLEMEGSVHVENSLACSCGLCYLIVHVKIASGKKVTVKHSILSWLNKCRADNILTDTLEITDPVWRAIEGMKETKAVSEETTWTFHIVEMVKQW